MDEIVIIILGIAFFIAIGFGACNASKVKHDRNLQIIECLKIPKTVQECEILIK